MSNDKADKNNPSVSNVSEADDSLDDLLLTLSSLHISSSTESIVIDDDDLNEDKKNADGKKDLEKKNKGEGEESIAHEDYLIGKNTVVSDNISSISSFYSNPDSEGSYKYSDISVNTISDADQLSEEVISEESTPRVNSLIDDATTSSEEPTPRVVDQNIHTARRDTEIIKKAEQCEESSSEMKENKNDKSKVEKKDQESGPSKEV